ncbi:MAG: GNAT family N-acetyltransferase [Chitinophagaceae bacterium]|nr:GNAT family N-acetyltransferase [Chitinophagaceae bacterium]
MHITIIKANFAHAAVIASIGKKSFRNAFGQLFKSKEELFDYLEHAYDPVKLTKSLKKGENVYFLAMIENVPAGFAKVKINSLNEYIEPIAQMELQKLYVLPEYQGTGAGTALIEEVKRFAHDINPDYLWLDTYINNEKAIRFYEKNGFEKLGKDLFTIGTQTFDYYIMGMPVAIHIRTAC